MYKRFSTSMKYKTTTMDRIANISGFLLKMKMTKKIFSCSLPLSICRKKAVEIHREHSKLLHVPLQLLGDKVRSHLCLSTLLDRGLLRFTEKNSWRLWQSEHASVEFFELNTFCEWYFCTKINGILNSIRCAAFVRNLEPPEKAFDMRMVSISQLITGTRPKKLVSLRSSSFKSNKKWFTRKLVQSPSFEQQKSASTSLINLIFKVLEKEEIFDWIFSAVTKYLSLKVLKYSPHETINKELDYTDISDITFNPAETVKIARWIKKRVDLLLDGSLHIKTVFESRQTKEQIGLGLISLKDGVIQIRQNFFTDLESIFFQNKKKTLRMGQFSSLDSINKFVKADTQCSRTIKFDCRPGHINYITVLNRALYVETKLLQLCNHICSLKVNFKRKENAKKLILSKTSVTQTKPPPCILTLLLFQQLIHGMHGLFLLHEEIMASWQYRTKLKRELSYGEPQLERIRYEIEFVVLPSFKHYNSSNTTSVLKAHNRIKKKKQEDCENYFDLATRLQSFSNSQKALDHFLMLRKTEKNLVNKLLALTRTITANLNHKMAERKEGRKNEITELTLRKSARAKILRWPANSRKNLSNLRFDKEQLSALEKKNMDIRITLAHLESYLPRAVSDDLEPIIYERILSPIACDKLEAIIVAELEQHRLTRKDNLRKKNERQRNIVILHFVSIAIKKQTLCFKQLKPLLVKNKNNLEYLIKTVQQNLFGQKQLKAERKKIFCHSITNGGFIFSKLKTV
eukprot:gnl/MRDRNA2_/MRDRNA2_86713_c0_seq1.p1 gnl/MRDRNA2_/MRDRNA2_86713_c0~~gnl/MRDRNA2_/MRDRNA2_86713_c0_seq1.p1  ORF type:complete len:743 (-),score=7.12 gnl/MRDRNA2_/MRDRNA2_86713_c0_seq1:125-2353(-)